MRGASHESLARASDALARASVTEPLGTELYSVAKLLDTNGTLRRALTDPARPAAARIGLAERLLSGKISSQAMEILTVAVGGRWSSSRDLGNALDQLSVEADVAYADAQGKLDEVEDELFRLGRVVAAERGLSETLTERNSPVGAGQQRVREVVGGQAG